MNNTITKINTIATPKEQHIKMLVIVGLCVLSVVVSMYMYFVGKIVFDVVARRQAESEIKLAQSDVGGLQVAYLSQLSSVDIASASQSGLSESKDTAYAIRVASSPTVGMVQ